MLVWVILNITHTEDNNSPQYISFNASIGNINYSTHTEDNNSPQ